MEKKVSEIFDIWEFISTLSKNAEVPSFKGRYAISRAYEKLKASVQPLIDEKNNLLKKYYEILPNGQTGKILEDMKKEDFEEEFKTFSNELIEVDVFQIKLSYLEDVKVYDLKGNQISMPAIYFNVLDDFIVDDTTENGI